MRVETGGTTLDHISAKIPQVQFSDFAFTSWTQHCHTGVQGDVGDSQGIFWGHTGVWGEQLTAEEKPRLGLQTAGVSQKRRLGEGPHPSSRIQRWPSRPGTGEGSLQGRAPGRAHGHPALGRKSGVPKQE